MLVLQVSEILGSIREAHVGGRKHGRWHERLLQCFGHQNAESLSCQSSGCISSFQKDAAGCDAERVESGLVVTI